MLTQSIEAKREPYCWLGKRQLRMLADVFAEGKVGNLSAARSVYLALREIASDRQSDTFIAGTVYIAQRAGVASKTVRRVIKILKQMGFVRARPRSANGLNLASEYTLVRRVGSIGPIYPSMGKGREISLRTREEYDEQSRESTARKEEKILPANENDIVIHKRTGERFNKRTKEFSW